MDTIRYVVALLVFVTAPAGILFWLLIHPFARFWRRWHPIWAYGTAGCFMAAMMAGLFLVRRPFLRVDFGGRYFLVYLGILCLAGAGFIGLKRRKHLTSRILVGWPELARTAGPGSLLSEGIYAKIRHPRYVEAFIAILGYSLIANHLASYIVTLLSLPMIHLIVLLEERELRERFGEAYTAYSERVPRFVCRADGGSRHPRALGRAWVTLTAAFLGHVIDEAENDFLAVYNPIAESIRDRAPLIPIPSFEFTTWIVALLIAIALLFGLSIPAFRRRGWIRRFAFVYGVVMIGNGLLHLIGSFVLGGVMPGTISSPILILAALHLLRAASGPDHRPSSTEGGS